MPGELKASGSEMLQVVLQLLEAGKMDTVYRDLYLQRARALFTPVLPYLQYLRLEREKVSIDDLLRQSRAAVDHRDWARVKELAARIRTSRQEVEEKRSLLAVGEEIYNAVDVPLDPFYPGFQSLFDVSERDLTGLRERALGNLSALEKGDPLWRGFYAGRRAYFQALSLASLESALPVERLDPGQIQREALRALDKGDMDYLESLLQEVLDPEAPLQATLPTPRATPTADLSLPFSEETLARAQRLGLNPTRVESNGAFHDYLRCCCAWRATFPDRPLTEGGKPVKGCTCGHACPPSIPGALKENLDLLMVHPFINSGGERYLPRFTAEEVLVEDFSEDEEDIQGSDLLSALGLKRRRAVSRLEIEQALLERGPQVIQDEVGLDPQEFRLLCIPFDLYSRLGSFWGWGQKRLWTHFDGYQVLKGGRLRALVGGDVRYGGIYDLCSVSRADEREGVIARFAVVRRERLVAG